VVAAVIMETYGQENEKCFIEIWRKSWYNGTDYSYCGHSCTV